MTQTKVKLPEGWSIYREEPPTKVETPGQYYAEKVIDGTRVEVMADTPEKLKDAANEYERFRATRGLAATPETGEETP